MAEQYLAQHRFPDNTELTEEFLGMIGGLKPPETEDIVMLPLPIGLSPQHLGLPEEAARGVSFGMQLQRIGYKDETAQAAGPKGASFWSPALQAIGLMQGNCVCPVISTILGTARQLELLLVGLGCAIEYQPQRPPHGATVPHPPRHSSVPPAAGHPGFQG